MDSPKRKLLVSVPEESRSPSRVWKVVPLMGGPPLLLLLLLLTMPVPPVSLTKIHFE
jgi:hypothetical protein